MLQLECPWCGVRDETEFNYGGEAHIARPSDPAAVSDAVWAEYLFNRSNLKGVYHERWQHQHGCRRWFHMVRNTATHECLVSYKYSESPPLLDEAVA